MRSAIVAAAFAVGALAVPLMERDVVYETDIVYATQYVTVTNGDVAATNAPAPSSSPAQVNSHYGHGHRKSRTTSAQGYAWTSSWATTWTESAPAATSVQEQASAYSTPAYSSSSEEESAPAPTSSEAPQSSEESTPTSSEAPASSAPASSASDAKPSDYQSYVLHHHNIHRSNHSAPALAWNASLAATAEKIGQGCTYAHDTNMDGGGYGQNIAAGVKADNVSAVITELFYNGEINSYGDNYGKTNEQGFDNSNFEEWGHMTQIVWKKTTSVGCATVDCSAQGLANTGGNVAPYFTVCNYYEAGNVDDDYSLNVIKPRGDATCYWNDGE